MQEISWRLWLVGVQGLHVTALSALSILSGPSALACHCATAYSLAISLHTYAGACRATFNKKMAKKPQLQELLKLVVCGDEVSAVIATSDATNQSQGAHN